MTTGRDLLVVPHGASLTGKGGFFFEMCPPAKPLLPRLVLEALFDAGGIFSMTDRFHDCLSMSGAIGNVFFCCLLRG
jgi:hypothetical protein